MESLKRIRIVDLLRDWKSIGAGTMVNLKDGCVQKRE